MRVFILERTMLRCVGYLADPPRAGDVVAWMRMGQDPSGEALAALASAGVQALDAERLLDAETTNEIDELGAAYIASWFRADGRDMSQLKGISLGKSYGLEVARQTNPRYLIRTGEIVRQVMEMFPEAEAFISDLTNGESVFRVRSEYQPMADIAAHVAASLRRRLQLVQSPDPLPPAFIRGKKNGWRVIATSFLGGMRPAWLKARLGVYRALREKKPRAYFFIGRGLDLVAERLAAAGRFKVFTSARGIKGTDALRYDHLFALPSASDIFRSWRLLRYARRLAVDPSQPDLLSYRGISYGAIVGNAIFRLLSAEIWPFLIVIAQTRKLRRMLDYSAVFVNGAGNEPMGISVSLTAESDCRVYLVSHGLDVHRIAIFCPVVDNPHVVHLVHGDDHQHDYRLYLPPARPTLRHLLGSPVTSIMNGIRGKRSPVHGKRLLIFAFGHLDFWNAARIRACDQYFAEVFKVAGELIAEGWTVTCRPHPHHPQDLEKRIAAELHLADQIVWNDSGTLDEALLAHDVVVSSLTSAYYQALYAGWPTIFYEPDYMPLKGHSNLEDNPMFTGLVTASDIERPVTNDVATLRRMIRETLDQNSPTSTFPDKFVTRYAHRFVGPHAADADYAIADFIDREFSAAAEPSIVNTKAA